MIGFLVMLAVCTLVAWLVSVYLGRVWGIVIGVLAFIAWSRFNKSEGTTGLFKSNLQSYFHYRRAGQSVDHALQSMVVSRYRFSKRQHFTVSALVSAIPPETPEDQKVITAIYTVFCAEQGDPPPGLESKYISKIRDAYCRMAERHKVPQ